MKVCDRFRSNSNTYDCIIPGSGGKDSFYAALVLKEEFGMNPLTVTWAPYIYTEWGWQNFKMWIDSGLPNYLYHPNGAVHRFLSRLSLYFLTSFSTIYSWSVWISSSLFSEIWY